MRIYISEYGPTVNNVLDYNLYITRYIGITAEVCYYTIGALMESAEGRGRGKLVDTCVILVKNIYLLQD